MYSNFKAASVEVGKYLLGGLASTELMFNVIVPAIGASRPLSQATIAAGGILGGAIVAAAKKFG